jgi:hypothetical protein
MKVIDYEKRKNKGLFSDFKKLKSIKVEEIQNYIPIYTTFFNFKENSNINLNHCNYLTGIKDNDSPPTNLNDKLFSEKIFGVEITNKGKSQNAKSFLKLSPVFDVGKFLTGKYDLKDEIFYILPTVEKNGHAILHDNNNISYVDSLFSFLSSQILNNYGFINALDFYGSFLSVVRDFSVDISEDIEYFVDSDYFMKNRNKLFKIDMDMQEPLTILDDDAELIFDNIETCEKPEKESLEKVECLENVTDLEGISKEIVLSETEDSESEGSESEGSESEGSESEESETEGSKSYSEDCLNIVLDKCLVQITSLEHCDNTLDSLIIKTMPDDELMACLFQIIMSLIVFQDTFSFTHNDLHTNNIMFIQTKEEYLFYCYKEKHYKVPTFGKIFKIIDFGRSIYKVNSNIICSNSFQDGGDAHTQYNTEPYYNAKKKRIDPNFSFDLCRLACSMWDNYFTVRNVDKIIEENKFVKIIDDWCRDDDGISVLYKKNGRERYPEFKLYKMIARTVHNHTPHAQLLREEFQQFCVEPTTSMNIDLIPKMI